MSKKRDLIGEIFGRLKVVAEIGRSSSGDVLWKCLCACGNVTNVAACSLVSGSTRSCGCLQKEILVKRLSGPKTSIETGTRFGRLVTTGNIEKFGRAYKWECECDCGKIVYRTKAALINSKIPSCGCYLKDKVSERNKNGTIDIEGQRFGRLVAIEPTDGRFGRCVIWKCKCDCGNFVYISINSLRRGNTKSCGCITKERMAANFGQSNHNWKGGISFEPYCGVWKDKEFKESIKERDDYVCQNPDCWGTSDKLVIHHIDYNKKNCHPNNLITLCVSCNARANKNREWHKEFYENIVKGAV